MLSGRQTCLSGATLRPAAAQRCPALLLEAVVRYFVPVNGPLPGSPPANTYAPKMPPAAGLGFVGSMIEYRSFTSAHGVKKSQRRPRLTVSLGLIFQSSCAYRPVYHVRSPITASLTYILELSTFPKRKLANSFPVVVRSEPLGNAVSSAENVKVCVAAGIAAVMLQPSQVNSKLEVVRVFRPGQRVGIQERVGHGFDSILVLRKCRKRSPGHRRESIINCRDSDFLAPVDRPSREPPVTDAGG